MSNYLEGLFGMYDEIANEANLIYENINDMLSNQWEQCEQRLAQQK